MTNERQTREARSYDLEVPTWRILLSPRKFRVLRALDETERLFRGNLDRLPKAIIDFPHFEGLDERMIFDARKRNLIYACENLPKIQKELFALEIYFGLEPRQRPAYTPTPEYEKVVSSTFDQLRPPRDIDAEMRTTAPMFLGGKARWFRQGL